MGCIALAAGRKSVPSPPRFCILPILQKVCSLQQQGQTDARKITMLVFLLGSLLGRGEPTGMGKKCPGTVVALGQRERM